MDNKKEVYRSLIGVFTIIFVVAGATYAWYTWKSSNTNIQGTLGCFDIDYSYIQDQSLQPQEYYLYHKHVRQ